MSAGRPFLGGFHPFIKVAVFLFDIALFAQINIEIISGENDYRTAYPGQRRGIVNSLIADFGGEPDGGERTDTEFDKARQYRIQRFAHALQRVFEDKNHAEEEIEHNADAQIRCADLNDERIRIVQKAADDMGAEKEHHGAHQQADDKRCQAGFLNRFANARQFAGTIILGGKRCHSQPDSHQRLGSQLFDAQSNGETDDYLLAERIADRLNDHNAQRQNRKLYRHRNGNVQVFAHKRGVVCPVFFLQPENRIVAFDVYNAADNGNADGNHRADGRTDNAEAAEFYQNQIENDV